MNNPLVLFYSKLYQYFNYAGIKAVNFHVQASFIFAVTVFFYSLKLIEALPIQLNAFGMLAVLLVGPIVQIASYLYFSNENVAEEIMQTTAEESSHDKAITTGLTIAFMLPMALFFIKFVIS